MASKPTDKVNLFKIKVRCSISDSFISKCQKAINNIANQVASGTFGPNGSLTKCTYKLTQSGGNNLNFSVKVNYTTQGSGNEVYLQFLDQHNPQNDLNANYATNDQLCSPNYGSHLNGVMVGLGTGPSYSYTMSPLDGRWFATKCGNNNVIAGSNNTCGPHLNLPYLSESPNDQHSTTSQLLSFSDNITTSGSGEGYEEGVYIVEPGKTKVNLYARNEVSYQKTVDGKQTYGIYYEIRELDEDEQNDTIDLLLEMENGIPDKNIARGSVKYKSWTYNKFPGDSRTYTFKRQEEFQPLEVTLPDDTLKRGKYYFMAFCLVNSFGPSNILTTPIFRTQFQAPTIENGSVSINTTDPMGSIKVTLQSSLKIWDVRIKITAKTLDDGRPDWSGAHVFSAYNDFAQELFNDEMYGDSFDTRKKTCALTVDLTDSRYGIKKNADTNWYNNTYYVCARVQAANYDYRWSKYDDNENRNTTGGYKYIGSVKTKNIATFESYPSTIEMGKATTPDAKIKIANKVKYRISVNLPGGIVKNQPASISTSSDDYTADNPLTVKGVSISSSIWDIIYKQLPGGVANLPSNVSDDAANNLTCTAELISYYKSGAEAGRKSKTLTIALKSSKSIVRTVRSKNGNTVKIGMVYYRNGTTIKKCVIWMRKEKTNSDGIVERGVINDAYVGEL